MSKQPASDIKLILARWFTVVAIVTGTVAFAFALWPVKLSSDPLLHSDVDSSTAGMIDHRDPALAAMSSDSIEATMHTIINGNMFSATRHAPTVRFIAPGSSTAGSGTTDAMTADDAGTDAETVGVSDTQNAVTYPLLSGIIVHDGIRKALLQLTEDDGNPALYAEGDIRHGYRIVHVNADNVVVMFGGRTRTYRLQTAPPESGAASVVSTLPVHM